MPLLLAEASSLDPMVEEEHLDNILQPYTPPSKDLLHSPASRGGLLRKEGRRERCRCRSPVNGGLSAQDTIIQFPRSRDVAFSSRRVLRKVWYLPRAVPMKDRYDILIRSPRFGLASDDMLVLILHPFTVKENSGNGRELGRARASHERYRACSADVRASRA